MSEKEETQNFITKLFNTIESQAGYVWKEEDFDLSKYNTQEERLARIKELDEKMLANATELAKSLLII